MKLNLTSSRNLSFISMVIFIGVALSMLFSTYYMNVSIRAEEDAQTQRAAYKQLGENLADASDYLTAEVRYFAITGDIEHLYNYWEEIFVTKQREQAIETFEKSNPPAKEREQLEQAKKYSDLLVETETYSMKLVLLSEGKTAEDYAYDKKLAKYAAYVMSYENMSETGQEDAETLRNKAIEILYDTNYEDYKTKIMSPIAEFNTLMNERLDKEVEERKQDTKVGTVIQVILALAALLAIGFLLNLMNRLYRVEKARNEAELANEAKSVFLAQMSHELRTPLNAVNGYAYLLEQTEPTEKQREYVKGIKHSAQGLLELINQILDFSKIEAGHLELECADFSLRTLLRDVEAVFTEQAVQKGLLFRIETDESIPDCLEGDSVRLKQVLINLLGNAFKFTEAGSVTLKVGLLEKGESACLLRFAVSDTGVGIEEEAKEKIFRPFVQSDASVTRKYGGTGLGLPICSEIIMLSGDKSHRLEVESKVGEGSAFFFTMDYPYKESGLTQAEKKKIPDFHGKKVLLTDDSTINIKVQSEILSFCGMITVAAESGKQAIALLEKRSNIDLIFMDIRMPEMDGYETARRIRQLPAYRKVPIIALTADAVLQVQEKVREAGMDGCLLKPVNQEELFALLVKYLPESEEGEPEKRKTEQAETVGSAGKRESVQVLGEITDCFLLLHSEDREKLQRFLDKRDFKAAEELVHQLKGITGNMECMTLYRCCCVLQKELQEERSDSYAAFAAAWEETLGVLRERQKAYKLMMNKRKKAEIGQVTKAVTGGTAKTAADASMVTGNKAEKEADISAATETKAEKEADTSAVMGKKAETANASAAMEETEREIYEKLLSLCEEGDTDVIFLLDEYKEAIEEKLSEEEAAALEKAKLLYDFRKIKECLKQLQENPAGKN